MISTFDKPENAEVNSLIVRNFILILYFPKSYCDQFGILRAHENLSEGTGHTAGSALCL